MLSFSRVCMLHSDRYVSRGRYAYSKLLTLGMGGIAEVYFSNSWGELLRIRHKAVVLIGRGEASASSAENLKLILLCHWIFIVRYGCQTPGCNTNLNYQVWCLEQTMSSKPIFHFANTLLCRARLLLAQGALLSLYYTLVGLVSVYWSFQIADLKRETRISSNLVAAPSE